MNALVILAATAIVGVDVGWQPLSDGGVEYIIQIEPQLLDTLAKDHDLSSDLPAGLDVRRFRITVGTAQLPRIMPSASPPATSPASRAGSDTRRRPNSPPPGTLAAATVPAAANTPVAGPPQAGYQPGPPTAGYQPQVAPPPNTPPLTAGAAATAVPMGPPQMVPAAPPGGPDQVPLGSTAAPTLSGPVLSGPGEQPAGSGVQSPSAIADHVSQALDDPNAPGRTGAAANAGQPQLPGGTAPPAQPPRTLEPDPSSEQLADYNATQHEAQRPNEGSAAGQPGDGQRYHERSRVPAGEAGEAAAPPRAHESATHPAAVPAGEPEDKPWGPLIAATTFLLLSISANVYLAWIAYGFRMRYLELLAQHGSSPAPA